MKIKKLIVLLGVMLGTLFIGLNVHADAPKVGSWGYASSADAPEFANGDTIKLPDSGSANFPNQSDPLFVWAKDFKAGKGYYVSSDDRKYIDTANSDIDVTGMTQNLLSFNDSPDLSNGKIITFYYGVPNHPESADFHVNFQFGNPVSKPSFQYAALKTNLEATNFDGQTGLDANHPIVFSNDEYIGEWGQTKVIANNAPSGKFVAAKDSEDKVRVDSNGSIIPIVPSQNPAKGTVIHIQYVKDGTNEVVQNFYFQYGVPDKNVTLNNPNQGVYEYVHGQQGVDLTKLFGVKDPTDAKYYYKDNNGHEVELTNEGLKNLPISSTPYTITIKKDGYKPTDVKLLVSSKSTTVINNNGSSTSSQPNTSGSNTVTTNSGQTITIANNIGVKGEAVYAIKPIYLYKNASFKKSERIASYPKQKRVNRPMFVVVGYERVNGKLRYQVKDVNHSKKTAGKTGYITASTKYVLPVYYSSLPKSKTVTVISKRGVYSYTNKNLTGKSKHYKKGTHLKVKAIVKHNLTTRYQLSNGKFITANKKLVIQGNY
ncbi:DUF5776 domain-containing protein [Lentilactobacillus sp. Marseille-Q4993]|uniref:DUF5776 domain-containing protein n=1 Tax=Lentilactobacillus sp. Marseille-Q4993 TaxID=3039492 RepID=UPI0024BD4013|nr:DUF5776 domain-containing protein [Lentilactobacillus sp. Marseille-Q4993]